MEIKTRTAPGTASAPAKTSTTRDTWLKLTRPHTLTASFVPVAIGTAFALPHGQIRLPLFVAMLLTSMLLQAATNMYNEYYDYRRGLDNAQSVGISGTLVRDGVTPQTVLTLARLTVAAAFLLGLFLCQQTSWWLLPVGLGGTAVGYLYSGGPYPLSATPFGEIFSGATMGLVIIAVAFFIQTGFVSAEAFLVAVPTAILIGAILLSNNIRDLDGDKLHGRRTLAILVGRRPATFLLAAMFATAALWVVYLWLAGVVGPWSLLALASLPLPVKAVRGFLSGGATPAELMPAMVATAQTNTLFGLLFAAGLLVQHLLAR
ncbi:1,4-dihydroxy-2-naphthoate polyprenyltransferase [Anaeroselena agilis]|uniref:1,4-dihydroxy-2-naphthoate octaprenyltransferase n=1 Tax=Anaeroselena agilis TaxID=3063788 RepID=A0ABU3NSK2_9FIRM|nr:1,4-dihydroxy-2-naphthoate polyprenyltransferase [Selenomonadales bacterium 4137-cl]